MLVWLGVTARKGATPLSAHAERTSGSGLWRCRPERPLMGLSRLDKHL